MDNKNTNENVADSRHTTCCFGPFRTQLGKGVIMVAVFGATLSIIAAISSVWNNPILGPWQRIICLVLNLLYALMYLSLIVGQQKGNRRLYLPYLIVQAISLAISAIMCLAFIGVAVAARQSWIDAINRHHPEYKMTLEKFRLIFGLSAIFGALSTALNGWFYSIVYRAYKLLKMDNYKQLCVENGGEH